MLAVKLLGQFDVRRGDTPVVVPSRAAQSLLAYLLLTAGTPHRREKLAGLLWPDTTDESARSNLRHELWRLRKAIESKMPKKKPVSYLLVDEISVGFNAQSDYWLDVAVVQKPIAEPASVDHLIETPSLYRGELLPGFYDEWVILEREHVRAFRDPADRQRSPRVRDVPGSARRPVGTRRPVRDRSRRSNPAPR